LHIGDPRADAPDITWRQYLEEYQDVDISECTREDLEDGWGVPEGNLEASCADNEFYAESWWRLNGSAPQAYYYLSPLPAFGSTDRRRSWFRGACVLDAIMWITYHNS